MDPLTIALSGMRSAELRLAASAHNVANLATSSFRPLRATQVSLSGGGSAAQVRQEASPREVDLAREIVDQMTASLQFDASLRVIDVTARMRGSLVDLLA